MRITQQDIAKIAKVSQATVSRVLAGDDKVDSSIRDRVMAAIDKHNYRPDVRAQSLRSKRTGLIGLVVKRPQGALSEDPFFSRLTSEIVSYLVGRPYHLCLDIAQSDTTQESIYDEMLRSRRVDGLILVESEARDARIHRLQRDSFPFVLIGNPLAGNEIYSVDNDNIAAAEMATLHLIESGYTRLGMIAGRKGITVSEDRITGFMKASGLDRTSIWHADFGSDAAREAAFTALSRRERPDALVVLDDLMAMGVVMAARTLGLRIPEDLGLVSFNDTALCDLVDSGLTSVSLNMPEIVRHACDRLLTIIEDDLMPDHRRVIVPCELKIRGSSRSRITRNAEGVSA
jgi:DNA-binding LacI/PurR family transcriptional regulator